MPASSRSIIVPAAFLLSVAFATGLSGCSGNPIENIVENGVEQAVEGATGGDVDLNSNGGLPEGFPVDDVPLLDGDISYGLGLGGEAGGGWVVFISIDDRETGFAELKQKLADAGFTVTMESSQDGGSFGVFTSDDYVVQATVGEDSSYGLVAQYAVTSTGSTP